MVDINNNFDPQQVTNLKGMNRLNGSAIDKDEHIRQSLTDILTTPIGSRVMRREYGSLIPYLIDQPVNPSFVMKLRSAVVHAVMRWEKRVIPTRISLQSKNDQNAMQGRFNLLIEYQYVVSQRVSSASLTLGGAM